MSKLTNLNPSTINILLLLFNGGLLALMLPLAKQVTSAGLSPVAFAFWQTLGAGIVLLLVSGRLIFMQLDKRFLKFCLLSSATGIALPNALAFFLVGTLGAGFTSTLYAFPPVFTMVFAMFMRVEHPDSRRVAGILLACI